MRIRPDDHPAHARPPARVTSRAGHRHFAQGKPLLSLSSPRATAPDPRRPNESHTASVGSRKESDGPGIWTEPGQAPVLPQVKQVADERRYASE
jgi:hypothetical protein